MQRDFFQIPDKFEFSYERRVLRRTGAKRLSVRK